jgi:hypothetical protein
VLCFTASQTPLSFDVLYYFSSSCYFFRSLILYAHHIFRFQHATKLSEEDDKQARQQGGEETRQPDEDDRQPLEHGGGEEKMRGDSNAKCLHYRDARVPRKEGVGDPAQRCASVGLLLIVLSD